MITKYMLKKNIIVLGLLAVITFNALCLSVIIIDSSQVVSNSVQVMFTAEASGNAAGAEVEYTWYVDGLLKQSGLSASYPFAAAPAEKTHYLLKVEAGDGTNTASCERELIVPGGGKQYFFVWDTEGGKWADPDIEAPGIVAETFVYNSKLTVRLENNSYYSFDSSSHNWENTGITAPAGSKRSFSPAENVLLVNTGAGGVKLHTEATASWNDVQISLPAGHLDAIVGTAMICLQSDRQMLFYHTAWSDAGITAPQGAARIFYTDNLLYVFCTDDKLYSLEPNTKTWTPAGIRFPAGTREVFYYNNSWYVRY